MEKEKQYTLDEKEYQELKILLTRIELDLHAVKGFVKVCNTILNFLEKKN